MLHGLLSRIEACENAIDSTDSYPARGHGGLSYGPVTEFGNKKTSQAIRDGSGPEHSLRTTSSRPENYRERPTLDQRTTEFRALTMSCRY